MKFKERLGLYDARTRAGKGRSPTYSPHVQVGAPGPEREDAQWLLAQLGPEYAGSRERWHLWLHWASTSGGEALLDADPDAQALKAELVRRGLVDEDERQGPPPPIEEVRWVDENDGTEHTGWRAT